MSGSKRPTWVLGVDIGTSSVRAIAYDERAMPLMAPVQRAHAPDISREGASELDPGELLDLICSILDELHGQPQIGRGEIAAVGISCFWHSIMALDARAQPLTPLLLWADTRPGQIISRLETECKPWLLHRRTGAGLHASYWPAKIRWMKQQWPTLLDSAAHLCSFAEYLHLRFTGRLQVSVSMASGTGLLNVSSAGWDPYALRLAHEESALRLSPIDDSPAALTPEFQKRWPHFSRAVWLPAHGDGACANVGAGGLLSQRVVISVGTSSAVRVVVSKGAGKRPASRTDGARSSLWTYRLDRDREVRGAALAEGGNLVAWIKETFRVASLTECEEEIRARPPDAGGLTVLPFIAGERSPDWIGSARAAIVGLHVSTKPVDILQAALESVSYQLRAVFDDLTATMDGRPMVIAAGAALLESQTWLQILAAVLEHEVWESPVLEASSRGAAVMALRLLGVDEGDLEPVLEKVHQPARMGDAYRVARERQSALYRLLVLGPAGTAQNSAVEPRPPLA